MWAVAAFIEVSHSVASHVSDPKLPNGFRLNLVLEGATLEVVS